MKRMLITSSGTDAGSIACTRERNAYCAIRSQRPVDVPVDICYAFDESVNEITNCALQIAGRIGGCDRNTISCNGRISPKDTDAFRATRYMCEPRFMRFALFARARHLIACYFWTKSKVRSPKFLTIMMSRAAVYRREAFKNLCRRSSLRETSSLRKDSALQRG